VPKADLPINCINGLALKRGRNLHMDEDLGRMANPGIKRR
jgi:hypothetical protein